jgi:hypothetical protein
MKSNFIIFTRISSYLQIFVVIERNPCQKSYIIVIEKKNKIKFS